MADYQVSFDHEEGQPFPCTEVGCLNHGHPHRAVAAAQIEHVARDIDLTFEVRDVQAMVVVATDRTTGMWEVDLQLVSDGGRVSVDDFDTFADAARAAYRLADDLNSRATRGHSTSAA